MYILSPRKSFDEQQTCVYHVGINANSTMFNKFLQNGTFSEHVDTVQKHHSNVAFISFAGRAEMISQGSNVALITFAGRAEMISRGFSIMRSVSERHRYSCERALECCLFTARAHSGWPNLCLSK